MESNKLLIDAIDLLENGIHVTHGLNECGILYVPLREVTKSIKNAPIVDAREVIHARWETECRNRKRCSNCSLRINTDTQIEGNFCPICGAMMDGGNEDV